MTKDANFAGFSGFAVRGLFFNMLKEIAPALAEDLHKSKRIEPYSVSPVIDESNNRIIRLKATGFVLSGLRF